VTARLDLRSQSHILQNSRQHWESILCLCWFILQAAPYIQQTNIPARSQPLKVSWPSLPKHGNRSRLDPHNAVQTARHLPIPPPPRLQLLRVLCDAVLGSLYLRCIHIRILIPILNVLNVNLLSLLNVNLLSIIVMMELEADLLLNLALLEALVAASAVVCEPLDDVRGGVGLVSPGGGGVVISADAEAMHGLDAVGRVPDGGKYGGGGHEEDEEGEEVHLGWDAVVFGAGVVGRVTGRKS
jgi:hypothetical protein